MRWPCKYNNILIKKGVWGGGLCPLETIDILETQFKWKPLQIIFFLLNFGAEPDLFFTIFFRQGNIFFKSPFETFFFFFLHIQSQDFMPEPQVKDVWVSSCDYGTYRMGDQRRLRCSHT